VFPFRQQEVRGEFVSFHRYGGFAQDLSNDLIGRDAPTAEVQFE
jgi:hypothetical protein